MPFVAVLLIVLLGILTVLLFRTRLGRHLFAVGGNPEAANRAGGAGCAGPAGRLIPGAGRAAWRWLR